VGIWEVLAAALQVGYRLEQAAEPGFHPGRTGRIRVGDSVIGVVGEIHPAVVARFGLTGRVAVGDLDLEALMVGVPPRTFAVPSPYPPVVFDLAFELTEEVPAATLLSEVRAAAGPSLERVEVFDVFRGPPLGAGRKSLAMRLTFRDAQRTLTDEDLVPVRERITEGVAASLGGRLRGG